jgi:uncharacterized RDD family membrane protein YckC
MQFHPKDLSELDELTEEHLGFSALSDGLGFTKQTKRAPESAKSSEDDLRQKALSGIGAVAAGPARPVPPRTAPAPGKAPVAASPRAVPSTTASVISEPAAPRHLRLVAFAADFLLISLPMSFAWWISFRGHAIAIFRQNPRPPLFLFGVVFAVYFLLSESFGGQSLGKMLLGLRVVEDDKYQKPTGLPHAAKRLFLLVFGASLGGLGLLASFWDAKRRPWHDRYSGSIVRQRA